MVVVLHSFSNFLLYKLKKVLVRRKFLISGFWSIYTFWDVLQTIWLFLKNVSLSFCLCASLCDKNFVASLAHELIY